MRMDGSLLPPRVPVAGLCRAEALWGFGGASTAQTAAGKQRLCAGLGEGSLSRARGLWSLLSQQQEGFSSSPVDAKLPLLLLSFLPCLGFGWHPTCKFPRASWAPLSPPCCVWDLYLILIYFFIGSSLSLLLFPARRSSSFALQRAAGWL